MEDNGLMRHKCEIAQKHYVHYNPALFHYILDESVVKTIIMFPRLPKNIPL